jgi:hypothetical protein
MIHKIFNLKDKEFDLNKFQSVDIPHWFLYDGVLAEIKCFRDEKEDIIYFNFFKNVTFAIIKDEQKPKLDEMMLYDCQFEDTYHAYYYNEDQSDQDISKALRNSSTLKINTNNSYIQKHMKVVFAEKGFVLCKMKEKYDLQSSFDRILLQFLLSLAYNTYTEQLISEVTESYNKLNYEDMIKLRDEIYAFGLKSFFHNPVKQNRHESFELWNLISKNYYVEIKHNEMKSQIADLTGVIETKYKDEQDAKSKRLEKFLGIIGFLLALTSLIGVYKDLKEFGLF